MVRAWWPDAGAGATRQGLATTAAHVQSMADAGFGGMELAMLSDQLPNVPVSSTLPENQRLGQPGVDQSMAQTSSGCCKDFSNAEAKTVGYGTENWQKILTQIYQTANSQPDGFVIDQTISQHWPVAFNNIDPNDAGQLQDARTAYSPITTADVDAGWKTVPLPSQRLWDLDNVPFVYVDHYAASSILKVASVASDGTPTFSYASLTDASAQTRPIRNAHGGFAGSAGGIMDQGWIDSHPSSFTANLTSGSTTISGVSSTDGAQRQAGSIISGPGIPDGTQVVSVSGTTIVLDKPATVTATGADLQAKWNINTVNADWGPVPHDPHMTAKVDSAGDRRRMADWQYQYQTTIRPATLNSLGCTIPEPGAALAAGDCVLFGTWSEGTGQTRSGGVNTTQYNREYVISIYDEAGTKSFTDFWENNILGTWKDGKVVKRMGDQKLIDLIRANAARFPQASLFEDSLEFSKPSGTGTYWSTDILQEMTDSGGYNAARYAPLLATGTQFDTSLADGELPANRVSEDWTATMADDVSTEHIGAIQKWAKKNLNYNFRVQDTGGVAVRCCTLDSGVHEASADSGAQDNARMVAGSAALTGSNWVTAESLTFTKDYTNPWPDVVKGLNLDWSSGINRNEWHGTPYSVTFNGANQAWPGWEFQHGNPTGWGAFDKRQAYWQDVHGLTDYAARSQAVLQGGTGKVDLAILRGTDTLGAPSRTSNSLQTLMDHGWNYHIIDDRGVQARNAVVTGATRTNGVMRGGVLDANGPTNGAKNGPGYKAIVVSDANILQLATVKRLQQFAASGLPIFFLNSPVSRVYGTERPGNNDTALAHAMSTLLDTPNVAVVSDGTQQTLLGMLSSAGITPNASYDAANLESLERQDNTTGADAANYYYLYNNRTATSLSTASAAGSTGIRIASTSSLRPGDRLIIGTGDNQETATIDSIPGSPASGDPNVILSQPLTLGHAPGAAVTEPIHTTVTIHGWGAPAVMNALTGEIEPIADYTSNNGTLTFEVTLDSQQAVIIQAGRTRASASRTPLHVTSTSGGTAEYDSAGHLVLRADQAGTYAVGLSNHATRNVSMGTVPDPQALADGWSLDVASFGPDASSSDPTVSRQTHATFTDNALGPWSNLPATSDQLSQLGVTSMAQVSGIGTYSTSFQLPADWNAADGAVLALGHGNGDMITAVTVNGTTITPVDQVTNRVDVGHLLKAGTNTIAVKLDTNLGNRVGRAQQTYGLTGVALLPYREAAID